MFYKETPFNDFTERLSNWIHERITGDVLLDYGTVNLMQNRYELRVFLERNARRHNKEMEALAAKYIAEGKKANGESESDEAEENKDGDASDKSEEDAGDGKKTVMEAQKTLSSMFAKKNPAERDADGNIIPQKLGPLDAPLPGSQGAEHEYPGNRPTYEVARPKVSRAKRGNKPDGTLQTKLAFAPPQKRTHA